VNDVEARERTLLIDDADDLRLLLRMVLESSGRYEVVGEAADGEAGVREARATEPDVVLLDLSMPRMDGLEALPHLQRVAPDARVIVLSGFAEGKTAAAALAAGASAYIEKGLEPEQLLAQIDAAGTSPGRAATEAPRVAHPDPAPPAAPVLMDPLADDLGRGLAALREALGRLVGDAARDDAIRALDDVDATVQGAARYARAAMTSLDLVSVQLADAVASAAQRCERPEAVVGPPRNGLHVLADASLLDDALAEVLANTSAHGAGSVEVTAWRDRDDVVVTIADDGPGFGEALPQAFTPLAQGPRARRAGTARGLGLAITAEAIRRMSGSVTAHDMRTGGAVVTIRLPVA
jgi:CheY-like chemotaxis protein/anti-sigma regulatory factor (Ser/Thr protein kinase)